GGREFESRPFRHLHISLSRNAKAFLCLFVSDCAKSIVAVLLNAERQFSWLAYLFRESGLSRRGALHFAR
ncbi:hypothetical protein ACXJY6_16670, partial [Vibrio sp. RC27]